MELTAKDRKHLESIGVPEEDFRQIGEAADATTYELWTYPEKNNYRGQEKAKAITRLGAVRLLGREGWLTGLARSAFHCDAVREVGDGLRLVSFDSRSLFAG